VDIGCCGFGMRQSEYFAQFNAIEIQQTFYQPPQLSTMRGWREKAPQDFHFALKAWQLITHTYNSTTYRRLKRQLSKPEQADCGAFQLSPIVEEAWNTTRECAAAVDATTILFQCPGSFVQSAENIKRIQNFFETIERPKSSTQLAWEPRGDWDPDLVQKLCSQLNLVHATDPFVMRGVTEELYFRLHGRTGWRYEYTNKELKEIASMAKAAQDAKVFFNNVSMVADATNFQGIAARMRV
jgi:uncharacterized protein YecE (DUF72 family)